MICLRSIPMALLELSTGVCHSIFNSKRYKNSFRNRDGNVRKQFEIFLKHPTSIRKEKRSLMLFISDRN